MIEYLVNEEEFTYEDAVEWIDYNTLNAIGYDPRHPIILFPVEEF